MDAEMVVKFRDMALMELKRAERYRNFLSLLVLNLSEFLSSAGRRKIKNDEEAGDFLRTVLDRIKMDARETDIVSKLDNSRLVMLLPETDKNGAHITGERMRQLLSEYISEFLESDFRFEVPVEIASFPEIDPDTVSFKKRLSSLLG